MEETNELRFKILYSKDSAVEVQMILAHYQSAQDRLPVTPSKIFYWLKSPNRRRKELLWLLNRQEARCSASQDDQIFHQEKSNFKRFV